MKLFVGNVSYDASDVEFKEHFETCGEVAEAVIIRDRNTNQSRGFGFVTFKNDDEAESAMNKLNGKDFFGRNLTVKEAEDRGRGGGGGGGGGYRGGGRGGYDRGYQSRGGGYDSRNSGGYNDRSGYGRSGGSYGRDRGGYDEY